MATSPTSAVEKVFRRLSVLRKSAGHIRRKQFNRKESKEEQITTEKWEFKVTEIPPKSCSVMEIRQYIQADKLNEAYMNLLSMRLELQKEQKTSGETASPVNLVDKEKNISMLFETLRDKISDIVRSSTLPSCNKELLVYVAHIILEEEKRKGEPGVIQGWMEAWRDAIRDQIRDRLKEVHLDSREQNTSWLAEHLGLVGKAVEEDLERVKTELLGSYPPDFNVFETYVSCHHEAVGEHLKTLLEKVTQLEDYYTLVDFIVQGNPSDVRNKGPLIVEQDLRNKMKTCQLEDFKSALDNIIIKEKEVWKMKEAPDTTDDGFLTSKIHTNICQLLTSYAGNLQKINKNLDMSFCLKELNPFHTRFKEAFSLNTSFLLTSDLLDFCLWVKYHIAYINSFNSLKEDVQCYKKSCSAQVEQLEKQVDGLTQRFSQDMMDQFKTDVKPFMDALLTKKWLKTDEDFNEVASRIENFSGLCKSMRAPSAQSFANDMHYYVAKEYVSQLMRTKYSCKKNKNEDAALKMRQQWNELSKLFQEMGSSLNWLYQVGYYLSDIIGVENEKDIKERLVPLVKNYPDISKKQFASVLGFRDNGFSLERHNVINQFKVIKQDAGNAKNSFFADIE